MKPVLFLAVPCCATDPDHHLNARDKRRDQVSTTDVAILAHGKARSEDGGTRMRSGVGFGEVIQFERVGEGSVAERSRRWMRACTRDTQNAADATGSIGARKGGNDFAPRQLRAVGAGGNRVSNGIPGPL